ncbi:CPSF A subunit region-domain-containing protein [Stachybotrys elegans]|uniref:CPSF A subunit region-domain-containing protein n=1 Tax=Stachybotrys elegans TaxID=80388 RepID=A0A8K0SJT0_9HYPO|nr:CPSF A subunit region-domain-containing protein [Stachybotrys elegans]
MATTSNMFLYSLTIQPPSSISQTLIGQFAGTKEQLIVATSGSHLKLLRLDHNSGKLMTVASQDVFGIIQSTASFRLAGSSKDYIILATDSGRISIVEFVPASSRFRRVHLETFGKSGVRRVVPGQYLAADPKGRACLIASIEKNKLVYILNRNAQAELTISSPLEAHKHGVLVLSLVALDVGYANPVFAALETDYSELDQDASGTAIAETELVYYELDLGLNHVVRKWSESVDPTDSLLFQVPGGNNGPSGVLVCGEETISYRHSNQETFRAPIPRRRGATEDPQRKRAIVAGVMHKLKNSPEAFFFLLQTEDGDLFKVTLSMREDEDGNLSGEVSQIKIKYFDTVPVASSLGILKSGFLFVSSEFGNHQLYQFEKLGDDDEETEFSSDDSAPVFFTPRPLENLILVESVESANPTLDSQVVNLTKDGDAPQIYSVSGNGARSRFRMLKHGLDVNEIVASELPGKTSAVWTTKLSSRDEFDSYIVLTSSTDTIVMSIGEEVNQVNDSGLLMSVMTLAVQQIGDDSLVQIHSKGIRHIRNKQITEWPVPQHRSIIATATNQQQIVIALSSGEIVYFETDTDGSLAEYDSRKGVTGTVTCLGLGQVPEGRVRSSFLAVGCDDCTVRILSLDPESTLENKSIQALTAAPSALSVMVMEDSSLGGSGSALYLHIGLHSGVYIRTLLDETTGDLTDTQQKFLGPQAIKLSQVAVQGKTCVLALSSKSWLGHVDSAKGFMLTPLNYHDLEWGWNFSSEQCVEGIIGIQSHHLRIFSIENLEGNLVQRSLPLTYTPRRVVNHPKEPYFYTIESDFNILPPELRAQLIASHLDQTNSTPNGNETGDVETRDMKHVLPPGEYGYPRGRGRWASCIGVIDPTKEKVLQTIHLEGNEAATTVAVVSFASQDSESFLVVGTGRDMIPSPRQFSGGCIHVYRFQEGGKELEFIHRTQVEEPPTAMVAFQGRVAVGIGKMLRIYDLGLKQMLRKAQADVAPQLIASLQTQGNRIIVGDVQQGITMVVYKPESNRLIPFVDDTIARWTTCTAMVDYDSVVGGDRFGNLWIVRCPEKVSIEADTPGDHHLAFARKYLQGSPNRLDLMMHVFVQDIPVSITKSNLVVGGQDVIVWAGLQGTIGALIPFLTREDVDFFQTLELHMRSQDASLIGRDHLMYRGYYAPVKDVIDGDLCERYRLLPVDAKRTIAAELDRSVREVERKISNVRTRSAF